MKGSRVQGVSMRMTQAEFLEALTNEFGQNPADWAFRCPACGDVATGRDFKAALEENPRTKNGEPVLANEIMGQECIGRTLGALEASASAYTGKRGCDWTAYGLLPGPLEIELADGQIIHSFPIATKDQSDA
jgi:hypothetical protein